jgi:hypothetical protein
MNKKYTKIIVVALFALLFVIVLVNFLNHKNYNSPYPTYQPEIVSLNQRICARPPPRPGKFNFTVSNEDVEEDPTAQHRRRTRQNRFEKQIAIWVQEDVPACAYYWYENWAIRDAITRMRVTSEGRQVLTAFLSVASSHFIRLKDLEPFKRKNNDIERWLKDMAASIEENYNKNRDLATYASHYWTLWATMATAVATSDKGLYEDSKKQYTTVTSEISEDGKLFEETYEFKDDYNYSSSPTGYIFSVAPMVMVAETLTVNGTDGYALSNGKIHKLVKRVLDELDSNQITIHETDDEAPYYMGELTKQDLAWLEVYHKRFPSAQTEKWVTRLRPLSSRFLGGDLTELYAEEESAN